MNEGKWLAVYTFPGWENKVAEQLTKKKIQCYCPQIKVYNRFNWKRETTEALFKSYVFVNIKERDELVRVRVRGVVDFMYWLGSPADIRDEEIDVIKRFLNNYPRINVEKCSVDRSADMKLLTEPYIVRKGNLVEVRNMVAKAVLPSLGYILTAETEVSAIKENQSTYSGLFEITT